MSPLRFNCTIFAYGQTGSGKTHTMMGYSGQDPAQKEAEEGTAPPPSPFMYTLCMSYVCISLHCHGPGLMMTFLILLVIEKSEPSAIVSVLRYHSEVD